MPPEWWPMGERHGLTFVTSVFRAPKGWESDADYVYIGLPGYAGKVTGYFGKPWACLKHPQGWQVGFREYMLERVLLDPVYAGAIAALRGKILVCFCKHKKGGFGENQMCHGDLLAEMAEWLVGKMSEAE